MRLKNRSLIPLRLALVLVVLTTINVPPWLVYKGNRIGSVCAFEIPSPETPQANFAAPIIQAANTSPEDKSETKTSTAQASFNIDEDQDKVDAGKDQQVVTVGELSSHQVTDTTTSTDTEKKQDPAVVVPAAQQQQQQQQQQQPDTDATAASVIETASVVPLTPPIIPKTDTTDPSSPSSPQSAPTEQEPEEHEKQQHPSETEERPRISREGHRSRRTNTFYARLSAVPGTEDAREQHRAVIQALLTLPGSHITIRHEFGKDEDDVLNVISFKLEGSGDGLEEIAAMEGVIGIYPVRTRKRPRALPLGSLQMTRPSLESAHVLTGIQMAREKLGLTGRNIKVGIIDTGIDYKHPALGGCFGRGCKVAYGYDFVGDDYDNGDSEKDTPRPDKDPMDCAGHGTHVAGIVAGRNTGSGAMGPQDFVGVAPDAILGAYRVFGCEGEVGDDVLLAAMKAAFRDGMDVVNLSLGGSSGWPEEPFATACHAYIEKGLHISIANGNDGEEGLFEDGAPATAAGAIAVGSVDNTYFLGPAADLSFKTVGPGGVKKDTTDRSERAGKIGMAMAADASDIPVKSFRKDISYVVHVSSKDPLGCTAYDGIALEKEYKLPRTNILVLLKRGGCTFNDKGKNIANAKLGGMLVYDIVPEQRPLGMSINGFNLSAAGLSFEDANMILEAFKNKPVGLQLTAQFSVEDQILKLASGGKISDFSSWGPDARLRYKPDIVTPGGMIYSTFPLAKGGFTTLQGTSMSSPYMAGIQALYLARYGKTEPAKLLNLLQSTAVPTVCPGSMTGLTSVFQQGGGLVSMERLFAADPPTFVIPTVLYLNDTQYQKLDHVLSFTNPSQTGTRSWTLVHRPAFSINGFEDRDHYSPVNQSRLRSSEIGAGPITMTPSEFTLSPGETGTILVKISPPTDLDLEERWLYSGYVEFLCQSKNAAGEVSDCGSSMVSYGGMHGNLAGVPILNPTITYPALQLDRLIQAEGPNTQSVDKETENEDDHSNQKNQVHKGQHHRHQPGQQLQSEDKAEQGHHHHRNRLQNDRHYNKAQGTAAHKNPKGKGHPKGDDPKQKNFFNDRKQTVLVGKSDDDWVSILVSVNFPTGLLTIEAESVCDDDRGGHADNTIRLEIGGSGQGRFQIETAAALEEAERVVAKSHQRLEQHGNIGTEAGEEGDDEILNDPEAVALMEERLVRSQELAFMPSGLYMPYEGYSQVMMFKPAEYGDELLDMQAKKPKSKETKKQQGDRKNKNASQKTPKAAKKTSRKSKSKAASAVKKGFLGRGRGGQRGQKAPRIPHKPHRGGTRACLPRILGLIPNGFNPWSARSDSAEGNTYQVFTWQGDLLLENHDAMNGAAGADVPQALRARAKARATKKQQNKLERRGIQKTLIAKKGGGGKGKGKGGHKGHKKKKKAPALDEQQNMVDTRDLPDGRYRLVVKVLKPWGVRGRASDVERWSSPIIVINRRGRR